MRIENAVMPGVEAVDPGDQVNIEVVAAGVAVDELRNDGDECGEEDDASAYETLGPEPGRRISNLRSLRVRRS
jgi:hypothetical protein